MKLQNYLSQKEKVTVITGGLGLIGKEIVKCFMQVGSVVVIIDNRKSDGYNFLKIINNKSVHFAEYNIARYNRIGNFIDLLEKEYGPIDNWINNAYPRTEDWGDNLDKMKTKSWKLNVDLQMNSYCICSAEIAKRMAKRKRGSIVNVSSVYGVIAPDFSIYKGTNLTNPPAYSAIKAGIIMFSRYLASYYGQYGVRVNVVCPGGVKNNQNASFVKEYSRKTILGRMAKPEEIAKPIVFLSSEAASYITGEVLMIDGGLTVI